MRNHDANAPAAPGPRLPPKLARACARLEAVLEKSSQAGRMTPAEWRAAAREIYGCYADPEPEPQEPDPQEPAPVFPDRRHLRPALARSAARLAELLVSPRNPAYWTPERCDAEIRQIYGLPPKNAV